MDNSTLRNVLVITAALALAATALFTAPMADADSEPNADPDEVQQIWSMTMKYAFRGDSTTEIPIWDFGDGSEPVQAWSGSHTYEEIGLYTVTQTVTNNVDTVSETWEVSINGYPTVEFYVDGQLYDTVEQTSANSELAEVPSDPQKDGYEFTGWYTEESCENIFDTSKDVVKEDMKLYAGWESTAVAPGGDDDKEDADDGSGTDWTAVGMIVAGIIIAVISLAAIAAVGLIGAAGAVVGIIIVIAGALKFMGVF